MSGSGLIVKRRRGRLKEFAEAAQWAGRKAGKNEGLLKKRKLGENCPVEDKPKRGKGLAEQSFLPARLGVLMASVAENIELHMKALDLKDKNIKREHRAYAKLAKEHRDISASLQAIAGEMEGYRDQAQGRPNEDILSDPKILAAFEKFMKAERQLIAVLKKRMYQDSKTLSPRGHASRAG